MIKIDYTDEIICGEPGPNFYWFGNTQDFFWLCNIMHPLGNIDQYQITLPYKKGENDIVIKLASIKGGRILNKYNITNHTVTVELDKAIWQDILQKFFLLSLTPGRLYIDLEGYSSIYEDANFIIDSQA